MKALTALLTLSCSLSLAACDQHVDPLEDRNADLSDDLDDDGEQQVEDGYVDLSDEYDGSAAELASDFGGDVVVQLNEDIECEDGEHYAGEVWVTQSCYVCWCDGDGAVSCTPASCPPKTPTDM